MKDELWRAIEKLQDDDWVEAIRIDLVLSGFSIPADALLIARNLIAGSLLLGGTYETVGGERVTFVQISQAGTYYETLVDEKGVHRYSRRPFDAGRVTGSPHDDPRNIKRPFKALAMREILNGAILR